jgi:hypothetical protein
MSNASETPRTDARVWTPYSGQKDIVWASFARELECENARLRASLIGLAYWARNNTETRASLRDRIDAALWPAIPDSHEPKN